MDVNLQSGRFVRALTDNTEPERHLQHFSSMCTSMIDKEIVIFVSINVGGAAGEHVIKLRLNLVQYSAVKGRSK